MHMKAVAASSWLLSDLPGVFSPGQFCLGRYRFILCDQIRRTFCQAIAAFSASMEIKLVVQAIYLLILPEQGGSNSPHHRAALLPLAASPARKSPV